MALQSGELITIVPKTGHLSGEELIALRHDQPKTVESENGDTNGGGLKKTMPSGTDEEAKALEHVYEQLEKQLSKPRIERLAGRTLAVWDDNLCAVRVVRKDGKFQNFGYNYQGQHYLEYYEVMFLLEMNRLQLEYYGQIVSIEQAYLLLLGENASKKYSIYLIYSNLTRSGFIITKFRNIHYFDNINVDKTVTYTKNDQDSIWFILKGELHTNNNHNRNDDLVCKSMPNYHKLKEQFQQFKNEIMNPAISKEGKSTKYKQEKDQASIINFTGKFKNNLKRSADEIAGTTSTIKYQWHNVKRHCEKQIMSAASVPAETPAPLRAANTQNKSFLDLLEADEKLSKIFGKFDIIHLKSKKDECNDIDEAKKQDNHDDADHLAIDFDGYLPRRKFRKSNPGPPDFRVIILEPQQSFPTHQQIRKIYAQQLQQVTLMIMTVNESKQVQAFMYYFS